MRKSVIALCILIVIAGRVWHHWPATEEDPYAFRMPVMFFQTLDFPTPADGDTIYGWKFEQCVRMNFTEFKGTVHFPGSYEFGTAGCSPFVVAGSPTVGALTFGPDDKVRFDQIEVRQ
jgi:hypothetical protein